MIDVTTLREWVLDDPTDSSRDSILMQLEEQAVADVQTWTGRYFGPPEERSEYRSLRGYEFLLSEMPVVGEPITLSSWTGEEWEDELEEDFEVYPLSARDGARIRYPTGWWDETRVRVTYTAGYEQGEEPADVRGIVLYLVSERWNTRGKEGLQSETIGGYAYTATSSITDRGRVADFVKYWRHPVVA